jgi:hypothetical protein
LLNRSKNQWLPAYPYKINLHTWTIEIIDIYYFCGVVN